MANCSMKMLERLRWRSNEGYKIQLRLDNIFLMKKINPRVFLSQMNANGAIRLILTQHERKPTR